VSVLKLDNLLYSNALQHIFSSEARANSLSICTPELTTERIRQLDQPIPQHIQKANQQYWDVIKTQYGTIAPNLQGINAFRYSHNITGGNQEFMEAATFQNYLETQQLMSYEEAATQAAALGGEGGKVTLTPEDYLLGIFDMTGELMRFAITAMATSGKLPGGEARMETTPQRSTESIQATSGEPVRNILTDLRELRALLEKLDVPYGTRFGKDVGKKMVVMQTCVEKVENALYGMVVRGSERPKGWMPELNQGPGREEIEGY
jgi:predicted translin family RNA/ssDNA-binding protein